MIEWPDKQNKNGPDLSGQQMSVKKVVDRTTPKWGKKGAKWGKSGADENGYHRMD
jgi:hypothetical protein